MKNFSFPKLFTKKTTNSRVTKKCKQNKTKIKISKYLKKSCCFTFFLKKVNVEYKLLFDFNIIKNKILFSLPHYLPKNVKQC